MAALPSKAKVERAVKGTPWDKSNKVLYDLCEQHPEHTDQEVILAKVLLIGRTYSAEIERRRQAEGTSDNFYTGVVGPNIRRSNIDQWIRQANVAKPGTEDALATMIEVHSEVTSLFYRISKLEKRSLASKYLHFHVPELFYIYDSRAAMAPYKVATAPRMKWGHGNHVDPPYAKFAYRCHKLTLDIRDRYGVSLTPRQLDNVLIAR